MADNQSVYKVRIDVETQTAAIVDLKGKIVATQIPVSQLEKEFGKLKTTIDSTKFNNFNKEVRNTQTSLQGASQASGGAATSVLELGRAVSDAPYGIRGMANNVSQLSSNMLFAAQKVDLVTGKVVGFSGVLKDMWKAMLGPLGILLAIQAVIAAVDYFYGGMKKAEGGADDYRKSLEELNKALNDNFISQDDVNGKIEEYIKLMALKIETDASSKKTSEELADIQKDIVKNQEYANKLLKQREDLEKRGVVSGDVYERVLKSEQFYLNIVNTLTEERNELIRGSIDKLNDLKNATDNLNAAEADTLKYWESKKSALEKQQKAVSKTAEKYKELGLEIKEVQKEIDAITGGKKPKGSGREKSLKNYKEGLFDLSKYINGLERNEKVIAERNEVDKLKIKHLFAQKDLEIELDLFKEKEELRLADFMRSKATDEEKAKAQEIHNKTLTNAEKEYQEGLTQLMATQSSERFNKIYEMIKEHSDKLVKAQQEGDIIGLDAPIDTGVDALENDRLINEAKYLDKLYWIEEEKLRRIEAGKEYEDLEQEKTNVFNAHENEKLALARKIESAKMDVALQGLAVVQQIAGEGSAVGKAAGVAMATISTYEAATAALGAKPYGPWNIAQAAIVTAAGLANVSKILNTKIPNGKGGTTGSGGGQSREFDFNLVGSTGKNQLANSIQGKFSQPIKAYVVSSDMTSQQQLDNKIKSSATFGGDDG
jgi:hypothetical protein